MLSDDRESNNPQTYRVQLRYDDHYWMIDYLRFGEKCYKSTFKGSTVTQNKNNLTDIPGYPYGDCRNTGSSGGVVLYDWSAALQLPDAYQGSSVEVGCRRAASGDTGTLPGVCRGICPVGWHIPTGDADGEFRNLYNAWNAKTSDHCSDCWFWYQGSAYYHCTSEGELSSYGSANGYVWMSTNYNSNYAYYLNKAGTGQALALKSYGAQVRCLKNY
jgi:uncharacterized protein (TIGR02145 family)